MKVSPVAQGAIPQISPNEGGSPSPDRMARAKAIAAGQELAPAQAATDPQVERAQNTLKRIKLKTQVSPDRHIQVLDPNDVPGVAGFVDPTTPQSDTLASTEQAETASEEIKPLSPQFAALAKQKRALQLKEQELLAKQKDFETQSGDKRSLEEYRSRIKANALKVLIEEGVTYDQLTEQILATNQGAPDLTGIQAEIQAMKDALENQNKSLLDRDAQAEKQVRAQVLREVNQLVAQGDDYAMIRNAGYAAQVEELIYRTFKKTGDLLDTTEAASLIENELLEESLKFARIPKVQSRLNPAPAQQQQPVQQDRPGTKVMRTLTNRDGVSSTSMSKRERAIAAMEGRLK